MNSSRDGAIVIGGHFQGLGVVRALASRGVRVAVIDSEPCLTRFSRHMFRFFKSPKVSENDKYLEFIIDLATRKGVMGWVIFPTDDETVYFLSKNRAVLGNYFRYFTQSWDVIRYVYDKKMSYRLAEKMGISIPPTEYPESVEDAAETKLNFPVLIKPAVMRDFFRITKLKVFRARNRSELIGLYRRAVEIVGKDQILLQEEIGNVSKNLYSFCPFFKNGRVLGSVTAQRLRQHPMDFGQASTYAVSIELKEIAELSIRFLSKINYYGLCEVEFIRDQRSGKFLFLEVNPRIWGWHTLAIKCGVNLPFMVYKDLMGEEIISNGYKKEVKWIRLLTDIPISVLEITKGRMRVFEYIASMKGDKEFAVLSRNDPMPFLGEIFMLPYLWIKRGF